MTQPIIIGIDAGTSQIKCVAFTRDGQQLAAQATPNEYHSVVKGGFEQSMLGTRDKVLETLANLIKALGKSSNDVTSLAITGQGDGLLLTSEHGEPLHDGWLWLDSRAAQIASEIENNANYADIYNTTGTAINAAQMRSQMRWLDQYQPSLLEQAHTAFHWKDYLYHCLTGARATDPSEALFTFGDFLTGKYSDQVLHALKLQHRQALLPPIIDGLTHSDKLNKNIAKQLGLAENVEVTLGYVDVICSALGGGLYNKGKASAMTILGTTGIHMRYAGTAKELQLPTDKTGYTIAFPGGGFVQLQSNMAATLNLDWVLGLGCDAAHSLGRQSTLEEFYQQLDENIQQTKPGVMLYHPYIADAGERGPFVNANARASFIGLHQESTFYDMVRTVIEGLGFAARDCYEALGALPSEIRLTGGAAKSTSVQKIIASVMNRPVRIVEQAEAAAAGAAMIAAVKHQYFATIDDCVENWLGDSIGNQVMPVESDIALYDELYQLYLKYRKSQTDIWSDLATIRDKQRQ